MHQKLGLTKKVTLQKSSMLNKEQRPPKHKYIMKSLEKRCELQIASIQAEVKENIEEW